jgi:hypothetical protein
MEVAGSCAAIPEHPHLLLSGRASADASMTEAGARHVEGIVKRVAFGI